MIGNMIKQLRINSKLTQEELSNILGINRSTLSKYETNENEPDFEFLIKFCDYFDVSADFVLGRTKVSNYKPIWNDLECSANESIKLNDILFKFKEDEKYIEFVHYILSKIDKIK